jgi:dTDP-4-dehydrorhamnose reductase
VAGRRSDADIAGLVQNHCSQRQLEWIGIMKILVIGNRGQLGQDVTRVLEPAHTVSGADLPELDIADRRAVSAAIGGIRPDLIVNCAAFTAVDRCETEPDAAWTANVDGPRNLAAGLRDQGGGRLVHISTDYVFDGTREVPKPYLETDPTRPRSVYGATKLAGEKAVEVYLPSSLIIRTAWLYGIDGPNFLKAILRRALTQDTVKVVNDQFGCPTWSYRLALQIEKLVGSDIRGVVHATGKGHCSWFDLARSFFDAMRIDCSLQPCTTADYPTPARRPHNSILSNQVLDRTGANVMADWRADVAAFARTHRDRLLTECKESR